MPGQRRSAPLPIIAVTGTVGKTTVASLLDRLARHGGWRTVTWLDSGVMIDGQQQIGELSPWSRGLHLVAQGELRLAVQELPANTVQAVGLPVGTYRGAIITNLAMNDADYALSDRVTRQEAANRAVVAAVHPEGLLVLNADDRAVVDLATSSDAGTVLWALRRQSPPLARHLRQGGAGLYIADSHMIWEQAGHRHDLGALADMPLTLGGAAIMQVQNLLAAAGAALALGLAPDLIGDHLPALDGWPHLVERALTLASGVHCRAIVAEARELLALRALARLMGRLTPGGERVVGTARWPADLTGDEASETARLLARCFGLLYLYGPDQARAAELIMDAWPPDRPPVFCVPLATETEAVRRLMNVVAPGDRLLLLAEAVPVTARLLDSYDAR